MRATLPLCSAILLLALAAPIALAATSCRDDNGLEDHAYVMTGALDRTCLFFDGARHGRDLVAIKGTDIVHGQETEESDLIRKTNEDVPAREEDIEIVLPFLHCYPSAVSSMRFG